MKKVLVIKTIIIALCLGAIVMPSYAQNDADPALVSMGFAISPIYFLQPPPTTLPPNRPGETNLTISFINAGITSSIAVGTVGINISLPVNAIPAYKAFPESIAALSGSFFGAFNWSYNSGSRSFYGVNNQIIGPGSGGTIIVRVKGFAQGTQVYSVSNIIRINPAAYPNEDPNNNNLDAHLSVLPFTILPVTLLNFDATKQGKDVLLSWKTAQETNSKNFNVQYSKDGTNWSSIGIVNAAGNSSTTKNYSFLHTTPVKGINYYRLIQVDIDGKFAVSETRTVTFSSSTDLIIFPNPTTDRVFISSGAGGKLMSIDLYSTDGKLVVTHTDFSIGNSIDMSAYAPGVYMLRVNSKPGVTDVFKVIKN